MKLTWIRTEVGRKTVPHDFAAIDKGKRVGRIYRHDTAGGERARWFWAMNSSGPGMDRGG